MTTHLSIRSVHEAGRNYQISQQEAERRGLPVFVVKDEPEIADDPRKTANSREGRRYRMARHIRIAKVNGIRQDRQLIALKVAYRSGLTLSELKSKCREQDLVDARNRAFYGMRVGLSATLERIAAYFDLHYSSVHYGLRKHKAWLLVQESDR
ncbi:helix-turn-helix domain-containing protein [Roseibium alexandrii]|uniref:helix-turn-helix domain-containing protein n=1 Tax=Roseibium alexandrii TaxID=388408 RepID=UPI003753A31B